MAPSWLEKFIVREDATPDPRRSSERSALDLQYTAVEPDRRTLTVKGETVPRYEVIRQSILGAWGSKCRVTSPADNGAEVAMLDFHNIPRAYMEIVVAQSKKKVEIGLTKQEYAAGGKLGVLKWKGTGMKAYGEASWELRDEKSLVLSASVNENHTSGLISVWVEGLEPDVLEELILVGITKIEQYKQTMRNAKTSIIAVGTGTIGAAV
ncbi:hypothetical protein PspLS_08457 [Pyricularia sp. CBS 133598]|nr:hypothetical protein PspLS_08457 [Pyricularia sp. CBS 133598]